MTDSGKHHFWNFFHSACWAVGVLISMVTFFYFILPTLPEKSFGSDLIYCCAGTAFVLGGCQACFFPQTINEIVDDLYTKIQTKLSK